MARGFKYIDPDSVQVFRAGMVTGTRAARKAKTKKRPEIAAGLSSAAYAEELKRIVGKPADSQTVVLIDSDGKIKTVSRYLDELLGDKTEEA
jgi:adenylate kinase